MKKYAPREKRALAAPKPIVSLRLSPTGSPWLLRPAVLKNTLAKKARTLAEVGILLAKTQTKVIGERKPT